MNFNALVHILNIFDMEKIIEPAGANNKKIVSYLSGNLKKIYNAKLNNTITEIHDIITYKILSTLKASNNNLIALTLLSNSDGFCIY